MNKIKKKIDETRTDSERDNMLDEMWRSHLDYRKTTTFGKRGIEFYEKYAGLHWDASKIKPGRAAIVINQEGATIEDILSEVTDSPPLFDVIGSDPKYDEESVVLRDVLNKSLWKKSGMEIDSERVVRSSLIIGSGHLRTICDPATRQIKSKFISPFSCFPAPYETDLQEMTCFISARLIPRITLQESLGDEIKDIKKSITRVYEYLPDMEKEAAKGVFAGVKDMYRQVANGLGFAASDNFSMGENDRLLLREYWVKDLSKDIDGNRKYPSWRYYVRVEDTTIAATQDAWAYPFLPICKMDDYVTEGYWGMGEIDWMDSPQYLINKFISQICNYMDMVANPQIKQEDGAGVPPNWVNLPGGVLTVNRGFFDKVDFMRVPPLPNEFLVLLNTMMKIIDDITGQRAGMPVRSATQAAMFSESQQQRVKPKIRHMEKCWVDWAEQCKTYIKKHWVSGYALAYRDESGNLIRRDFEDVDILDDLNVSIMTGASVASSKFMRISQMAQLPELDLETKLKTMDWPNASAIAAKVEERKGEIAQMKMQMEQMVAENQQLKTYLQQMQGGSR